MILKKIKCFINSGIRFASGIFLSGLFTLLPIILTLSLFSTSFKLLKSWLEPIQYAMTGTFLDTIPHAEFIIAIATILLIGTILRIFLFRSIVHGFERALARIPLIRPIYTGLKQLVNAFSLQDQASFKQVVIVEFPRKGIYSIGFMTSELPTEFMPHAAETYVNVFIPTTPNPTSGFLIMLPQQDIAVLNINRQEAMALIISGGLIVPERFKK